MLDRYNRAIDYLRISVTDRCNLRCQYCMPAEGIQLLRHEDILSFDEIAEVTRTAVEMGVWKVRITGGEPLVRKGIVELVRMLAEIQGIRDLAMTTNGQLLGKFARELREAGLMRVNVSLDTLDAEKYRIITRGGDVEAVLDGIEKARQAGLSPIKINCVRGQYNSESDAVAVKQFADERGLEVRFIREMDLAGGEFYLVEGGDGGNCRICNRLRLTSNGLVKPCLFNATGFSVRELGARKAILSALENKPKCGTFNEKEAFYNIGG
jgi:cyclic pyranopterin phosphate synthase